MQNESVWNEDDLALALKIEGRAIYLLAMREHGSKELATKLRQKFETAETENLPDLVDFVVSKCQENNALSDERYVESYVRMSLEKGQGPYKIKQKLQLRTDEDQLIASYLALDESEWIALAKSTLDKKYGDAIKPEERKEQAKRMRFLQSRGFSQNQIWKAFQSV